MKTTLGALACLTLLTGCSSGIVDGAPAATGSGSGSGEPAFSPCDDIPDDAISALGYDTTTESRDILGVEQPGWSICRWENSERFLAIMATTHSLDEIRANDNNVDFVPVEIDGRESFAFRETSDTDRRRCDVALSSGSGAVTIRISYVGVDPVIEDPCQASVHAARDLAAHLPI